MIIINMADTVSKNDYDKFRKDYVWMALSGKKYGAEFCSRFDIHDYVLKNLSNIQLCDCHIQRMGYVK